MALESWQVAHVVPRKGGGGSWGTSLGERFQGERWEAGAPLTGQAEPGGGISMVPRQP